MKPSIKIDPSCIETPAYFAIYEGHPHIVEFVSQPEYTIDWFDDKNKVLPLITKPLRKAWHEVLVEEGRIGIKLALQYALNHDEHIYPRTGKNGSVVDAVFAAAQDIGYLPEDPYYLCLWMWEALFPDEDWHTDISDWEVVWPTYEKIDLGKKNEEDLQGLVDVLKMTIRHLEKSEDSAWASKTRKEIIQILAAEIEKIEKKVPIDKQKVRLLFAPTGSLQEISIHNGWGDEFIRLSSVVDKYTK